MPRCEQIAIALDDQGGMNFHSSAGVAERRHGQFIQAAYGRWQVCIMPLPAGVHDAAGSVPAAAVFPWMTGGDGNDC